jgi:outer membrane protein TolC
MHKLIPLIVVFHLHLLSPLVALAQEQTGQTEETPAAEVPDPNTEEGAAQLAGGMADGMADDEAIRGLDPVDPSVYVDAFATLVSDGGETADSVASAAVETAPQMMSQRASMRAAEHNRDRQWLNYMPQVGVSFGYTRLSSVPRPQIGAGAIPPAVIEQLNLGIAAQRDGSIPNEASADVDEAYLQFFQALTSGFSFPQVLDQWSLKGTLSYPVTDLFLTIMPNYEAFEGFADAERLQLDAERATVDLRAREAFYNHVRAQAKLAVALAAQRQTEANRTQVEALVRAGVSPRVDLMRVEAQNAAARVGVARAQGAVQVSAHILRTLMHRPSGRGPIPIGENLAENLPELHQSRADLQSQALESRAEMLAIRRLVGARDDMVTVRSGGRWPQIFIQGQVDYANPNQRVFPQTEQWYASWAIGAVLQYTLNQTFEQDQLRSAAQAELDQTRADLEALRDAITIEVDRAFERFQSASTALTAAGAGLQAAEEAYRVRQEELAAGTAVARDLVDAESDLTRARIDLVDSIIDVRIAYAQLERAVNR